MPTNQPPPNCPNCEGDDVDHYGDQYDSGTHFDYLGCGHCGSRWTEVYEFSHIEYTLRCTSTDPTDHQGDTCPIHELR